jgi:hypothetical protein
VASRTLYRQAHSSCRCSRLVCSGQHGSLRVARSGFERLEQLELVLADRSLVSVAERVGSQTRPHDV